MFNYLEVNPGGCTMNIIKKKYECLFKNNWLKKKKRIQEVFL